MEIRIYTLMLKTSDSCAESEKKSYNTSLLLELTWSFLKSCSFTGRGPENRSLPSSSARATCTGHRDGGQVANSRNVMLSEVWGRLFYPLCSCLSCPKSLRQMPRFLLKASWENQHCFKTVSEPKLWKD